MLELIHLSFWSLSTSDFEFIIFELQTFERAIENFILIVWAGKGQLQERDF